MHAVLYKNSQNEFVILDAYFKGRWSADKESLIIYLNYLDLREKYNERDQHIFKKALGDKCLQYDISLKKTQEILNFIYKENMPRLCNYDPIFILNMLDKKENGIITPPTPIIEVTPYCNYGCTWCYIPPRNIDSKLFYRKDELQKNVIDPMLEEFGLLEWCLTGGEPNIEKEKTMEIANLIKERSLAILGRKPVSIYLLTNGYNLEKYAEDYKKAGINCYQVSLTSPIREHENLLRKPKKGIDSFEHAVAGLRKIVSLGMRAEINMIVQPMGVHDANNLHDIDKMFELAKEIGVKMLRIIPAVPCGTAKENHIWMSKKEYDIVRNYVREGRKKVSNMEIDCPIDQEIEKDREIFCRAGTLWVYVNFKGEVYPCNNIQDRESICWDKTIKEDKLTDIWRNSKLLNFMRDYNVKSINEECMECSYRVECVGECRALAWSRYRTYNLNMKPEVCFKDLNIEEFRGY